MKRVLLASAAFAALTVSVPASAQVGDILRQGIESILGGNHAGDSISQRHLVELNSRIQAGYQRGQISQSEANRLQNELRDIAQREQAYSSGGFSRAERADLQRRLQVLESRIQQASYNGNRNDRDWDDRDRRGDRDWDRRDRDDDDDDRYDRRDRDDRYGRDGRWNNDDRRDGRSWCPPGLERKDNGCQPPGQAKKGDRYSNHWGQVPAYYGQRYRDTNRFIFRYNDGRIYQIDRRTGRVVNVTTAPRRR